MEKEKFLKEYLVERKGTNSLKWDALDKRFEEVDRTPAENLAYQVGWTTLL